MLLRRTLILCFFYVSQANLDECNSNYEFTSPNEHHFLHVDRPAFHAWFKALDVDSNITFETDASASVVRVPDGRWYMLGVRVCGGEEEAVLTIPGLRYKTVLNSLRTRSFRLKTSSDGRVMWTNCNMTLIDIPDALKDQRPRWIVSLSVSLLCVAVMACFAWLVVRSRPWNRPAVGGKRVDSLAYSELQGRVASE
ncbi:uncharacterized protein LOC125026767 isoform X2 [Penaeus chinensis]|nr:uncharacterized protein LOC125026767 isoform X2 [Penaeus chinensis]XP_047471319.1 uncharacterized protein LOC125026767 isoform X2 [Penaeus chinensis]XP_047471321.1 uncharacterized protein LOC125026767 isoform X2 [Penaeus chinensis]